MHATPRERRRRQVSAGSLGMHLQHGWNRAEAEMALELLAVWIYDAQRVANSESIKIPSPP